MIAYDIEWDTDGEKVKLPKKVKIPDEICKGVGEDDYVNEVGDWLSDKYGWCIFNFKLKS